MTQLAVLLNLEPPPSLADADFAAWWAAVGVPLIDALAANRAPVGLVLSGPLLGWLTDTRPPSLLSLRALVDGGQVELVATGFHGPVLSAVPADDATDQVLAHLTLVRRLLDARPRGAWLPRGVWDPSVPRVLERADIAWTVVDDAAISSAHAEIGLDGWGVWATEREGHPLLLLANDSGAMSLRGAASPDEVAVYLQGRRSQGAEQLVCAWDVARRGLEDPRELAVEVGWVVDVLRRLSESVDLTLCTPSAMVGPAGDGSRRRGRVYLSSWAPEAVGVPWERLLLRSAEADRLHKRMLRVSRQLMRLGKRIRRNDPDAPDPDQVIQARRYLHRAQGAAHYEPAGIQSAPLRHRAWRDLLRAEDLGEHAAGTHRRLVAEVVDLGSSARPQVLLRTPSISLVADPELGGGLSELGLFPAAINLVDPQGREGRAMQAAFVEHFPHPETPIHTLQERGLPVHPVATIDAVERAGDAAVRAQLSRDVVLATDDGPARLRLTKAYSARVDTRLDVLYELANQGDGSARTRFAVELPLTLGVSPEHLELVVQPHRSSAAHALEYPEVRTLAIHGGAVVVRLGFQRPARVWVFPAALGVTVWAEWPLEIWSQEATRLKIKLEVGLPDALDDDDDGVPLDVLSPAPQLGDTLVLQRPKPHPEERRSPAQRRLQASMPLTPPLDAPVRAGMTAPTASPVPTPAAPSANTPAVVASTKELSREAAREAAREMAARLNLRPPSRQFKPIRAPLYAPPRPRQPLDDETMDDDADDAQPMGAVAEADAPAAPREE